MAWKFIRKIKRTLKKKPRNIPKLAVRSITQGPNFHKTGELIVHSPKTLEKMAKLTSSPKAMWASTFRGWARKARPGSKAFKSGK
jgi:hypothetical protein